MAVLVVLILIFLGLGLIFNVLAKILKEIRKMSAKTDAALAALAQLDTDVSALIAQGSSGADAFADQVTAAATATDTKVKAALTPAP